jgi:hypothetical protein
LHHPAKLLCDDSHLGASVSSRTVLHC